MKSVYIAHSVTNAHHNMDNVSSLVSWLKQKKFKIIRPEHLLFADIIASEAIQSIERADLIIADVSAYSHGVGFELGYAYSLKKHIILISHCSSKDKISKFLTALFPAMIYYKNADDLLGQLSFAIKDPART
jgi:nucleoside 2-deoxyribosyltransferase